MDVGASNSSSIPTTDDQELASLLAGLNSEQHEVSLPSEESDVASPSTTPAATDDASAPADSTTATAEPETTASETEPAPETAPVDPTKPAASVETDIASLDVDATSIATPSPVDVMDELNAHEVTPTITESTTTPTASTADELTTPPGAKPLEPLDLDAATIAAAADEAEQKASTATGTAVDATPTAAEEVNAIRDKILNYLSEMIRDINQPPQEKFETIVSILRGTGDRSLLKDALETAIQIEDPSSKAKALVELVNALDELVAKK